MYFQTFVYNEISMLPAPEESPTPRISSLEIFSIKKQVNSELSRERPNSSLIFSKVRKLNGTSREFSEQSSHELNQYLMQVGNEDYQKKLGLVKEVYTFALDAVSKKNRNGVLEAISLFEALGYAESEPVSELIKKLTAQFNIAPGEKFAPREPAVIANRNPFKGIKTKVVLALGAVGSLLSVSDNHPTDNPNPAPQTSIASASELTMPESQSPTPAEPSPTAIIRPPFESKSGPTATEVTKPTAKPALTALPTKSPTPQKEVAPIPKKEAPLPSNLFKEVIFPKLLQIAEKKRAEIARNPELAASLNPELKDQVNLILLGIGSDDAFTDSIIILSFNKQSGEMSMVNLPRDMQDPRVWKHTQSAEESRANAAYTYGGLTAVDQMIADSTGLSPDAALVLNYRMIDQVVDAMGGLEIDLPETVHDDNIHYFPNGPNTQGVPLHFEAGHHKLTGFEARRLIQSRRGTLTSATGEVKDSSDYVRAARQQEVLKAMLAQLQTMLKKDPLKFVQTMNKMRDFVNDGYATGKIDTDFDPNDLLPNFFDTKNILGLVGTLATGKFDIGIPFPKHQIVVGQENVILGNVQPSSGAWVSGTGEDINSPPLKYYAKVRQFIQSSLQGIKEKLPQSPKVVFVPGYMQKGENNLNVSMAEVGADEYPDPKIYMAKLKESIIKDASAGPVNLVGFSMGAGALEMFFESGEYDSLPQNIKDNIRGIVLINARDLTRADIERLPEGLRDFYTKLRNLERMRNSGKPVKVFISRDDEQVPRAEGVHIAKLLGILPVLVEGNHFAPINSPEILANIVNN